MTLLRKNGFLLFLLVTLAYPAREWGQAPSLQVSTPITLGSPVTITAAHVSGTVYLKKALDSKNCAAGLTGDSIPFTPKGGKSVQSSAIADGKALTITIAPGASVSSGDEICAEFVRDDNSDVISSGPIAIQPKPADPLVRFSQAPVGGFQTLVIQGATKDRVAIVELAPGMQPANQPGPNGEITCSPHDTDGGRQLGELNQAVGDIAIAANVPQPVSLASPLIPGSRLCLIDHPAGGGASIYSYIETVQNPPQAEGPTFKGRPTGGRPAVAVEAPAGAVVSLYQFDFGFTPKDPSNCGPDVTGNEANRLLLEDKGGQTTAVTLSPGSAGLDGSYTVSLASPLVGGTQLCIEEYPPLAANLPGAASNGTTGPPVYSEFITVHDPYDLPMGRFYYTAGAMITNFNGSNGSSSAAEYVDVGMAFSMRRERAPIKHPWGTPGLSGSLAGRFSQIPVAAPSANSNSGSGSSNSTTNGTLNILSTQESARVLGAVAMPVRARTTEDKIYSFFFTPVGKAAFETLLNPAATANGSVTGGTGAAPVTATFAPVYYYYAGGLRVGMRQYPRKPDPAPRTLMQLDVTIGRYSNLQNLVCGNATLNTSTTQPTNTSCYQLPASGSSVYTLEEQRRMTLGRIEAEGFIHFPNSPFVLGLDANLPQTVTAPRTLDIQNKPGGEVSIYFGITGNLFSLFKNPMSSTSGQ